MEKSGDLPGEDPRQLGEAHDWKSLLRTAQVGLPMLLSYDSKWTCSRLRYQVLLNCLRLFRPGCEYLRRAEEVFARGSSSLMEQFQMSDLLDLRLVDAQGTSVQTAVPTPAATVQGEMHFMLLFFFRQKKSC